MLHQLARAYGTSPAMVGAVAEEYNVDDGQSILWEGGPLLLHQLACTVGSPQLSQRSEVNEDEALLLALLMVELTVSLPASTEAAV